MATLEQMGSKEEVGQQVRLRLSTGELYDGTIAAFTPGRDPLLTPPFPDLVNPWVFDDARGEFRFYHVGSLDDPVIVGRSYYQYIPGGFRGYEPTTPEQKALLKYTNQSSPKRGLKELFKSIRSRLPFRA